MLKRTSLRFLFHQAAAADCVTVPVNRGTMALSKELFRMQFCGLSQMSLATRKPQCEATVLFDSGDRVKFNMGTGLVLRCCGNLSDGTFKREGFEARAVAPYRQLLHDPEIGMKDLNTKLVNGPATYKHGSPLGFPEQSIFGKLVVAVDVDEVLGSFLAALNKFIADRYALIHSVSEYHVYEFFKIWNCSRKEADLRVHEFFKTSYFKTGIYPIPGAQRALVRLSRYCSLSVVTSRQNVIKDHTIEWIERHYPGLFQEIHFGNHFALDGQSRPKSEICRSMGAQVLIDDNPRYAIECAEAGMRVLLFDYDNSYPWCKTGSADLHPLVTKVHNWHEVEQQLLAWIIP
ncbi:hypothetical protein H6P81_015246 [Aristolochia fimbriata]|uniref:Tac7077 n=1 Tax=Aristolochia fimbriata TaxID=158543 RepID=A0AAV7E7U3_ARIFI|nr:hypothetical protein H6P81_015246 [Aristolochia fimbriata]